MIIDLADEILEFTNLVVVTLFFPFLPPWDIYDDLLYLWNKKSAIARIRTKDLLTTTILSNS